MGIDWHVVLGAFDLAIGIINEDYLGSNRSFFGIA